MQLRFSRRSGQDLDRLFEFLIQNKASLKTADKAILTIQKNIKSLLDDPETGTALEDDTQRRELYIKFGKGNYVVRYIPDYSADCINILRIYHSREER